MSKHIHIYIASWRHLDNQRAQLLRQVIIIINSIGKERDKYCQPLLDLQANDWPAKSQSCGQHLSKSDLHSVLVNKACHVYRWGWIKFKERERANVIPPKISLLIKCSLKLDSTVADLNSQETHVEKDFSVWTDLSSQVGIPTPGCILKLVLCQLHRTLVTTVLRVCSVCGNHLDVAGLSQYLCLHAGARKGPPSCKEHCQWGSSNHVSSFPYAWSCNSIDPCALLVW